jgi:hypothetical protein
MEHPVITEVTMLLLRRLTPAVALLLCAGPAAAKTVCFEDGSDNVFVLQKLKKPKRAGATFSIRGYAVMFQDPAPVPITGTGVGLGDGRVHIGITVYDLSQGTNWHVLATWNPVTAVASTEGDFGSGGWDEIPCKTVVIPKP